MIRDLSRIRPAKSAPQRWSLLVVIAWLNIALAPCAMAFGSTAACPHNATPDHAEMMMHEGHHSPAEAPDCALVEADCCGSKTVATDSRTDVSPDKQQDVALIVGALSAATRFVLTEPPGRFGQGPPERFATSPPVHVLNCVYLD